MFEYVAIACAIQFRFAFLNGPMKPPSILNDKPRGNTGQDLPEIPGGWSESTLTLAGRTFQMTLPASPDEFLDSADVQARHSRDGFMPYWPYLWPAAHSMANWILQRDWDAGARVLEIGAGIGLVGLAMLSKGLAVTLSDYDQTAVDLALHNARKNDFAQARGLLLDWRNPPDVSFPIVVGCDVLYEGDNHDPVLELLNRVLCADGVCWIGDPGRQHSAAFCRRAAKSGFHVRLLSDECFETDLSRPNAPTGKPKTQHLSNQHTHAPAQPGVQPQVSDLGEPGIGQFRIIVLERKAN